MSVSAIPAGFTSVTAYLSISGAAEAIDFYQHAFGAEELLRFPAPDGKIGHAELKIGNAIIMLADQDDDFGNHSPTTLGGSPVTLMIYTDDCDAMFARALEAGATEVQPLKDQFYGDRSGTLKDAWGHVWTIATHVEDVSEEEMQRRMQEMFGAG